MGEQRRYDRFLLETEIDLIKPAEESNEAAIDNKKDDDDDSISRTKSKNLSASGICITTEAALITGDKYILRFTLPGQYDQIIVEGKVVWSKGYTSGHVELFDNGIEFTKISKDQHDLIEEFRLGSVYET